MNILLRVLLAFILIASCDAKLNGKKSKPISNDFECTSDDDCRAGKEYCSGGVCKKFGFCRDLADCLNPSNEYSTARCDGYIDCVDNQCRRQCSTDECPDGQPVADCFASPCSVSTCESPSTCVDYYCGGCNALFFDPKGDLACGSVEGDGVLDPAPQENDVDPPSNDETSCSSDDACGENEYCADGVCLEMGSCETQVDCFNPSNIFFKVECSGHIMCTEEKICKTICGPFCPNDLLNVACGPSICEETPCDEDYVSCAYDYCGECKGIFFDAQGSQICTTKEGSD
ncbi:hypothetical protein FisN_12Lh092 [Fistulifera solaris]|uniref:Uncharacterized protein n=1 Tax=Fistulifera solaris TaxID=1519565 RepID=A0A1Z5JMW8_FISSO|nr:hypothetical protein FisN_12Lh092 [Fistulifera solaris]|eukprot:GAX15202.1 hypothetical protein FisN_12Lh092 [Fistulifera solaris]